MAELPVLFVGSCNLCRGSAAGVRRFDRANRIEFLDVNDPAALPRFPQANREEALRWMQAVDSSGTVFGGSDAWARIGGLLPGWKFFAGVFLGPVVCWFFGEGFGWFRGKRFCWESANFEEGPCQGPVARKPRPLVY